MVTVYSAVELSATVLFHKDHYGLKKRKPGPTDYILSSLVQFNKVLVNGVDSKNAGRTHQCSAAAFSRFPFILSSAGMDTHSK